MASLPHPNTDDHRSACIQCQREHDAKLPDPGAPAHVWVVYTEWERNIDGSNAEINGVFLTEPEALAARQRVIDEYRAEPFNKRPYFNPATNETAEDGWDFDTHYEVHVIGEEA